MISQSAPSSPTTTTRGTGRDVPRHETQANAATAKAAANSFFSSLMRAIIDRAPGPDKENGGAAEAAPPSRDCGKDLTHQVSASWNR